MFQAGHLRAEGGEEDAWCRFLGDGWAVSRDILSHLMGYIVYSQLYSQIYIYM